jgi:hypothetical protein
MLTTSGDNQFLLQLGNEASNFLSPDSIKQRAISNHCGTALLRADHTCTIRSERNVVSERTEEESMSEGNKVWRRKCASGNQNGDSYGTETFFYIVLCISNET